MKVLHNANEIKCSCGSVLEYERSDIQCREHGIVDHDDPPFYEYEKYGCYVSCPVCHTRIRVRTDRSLIEHHLELEKFRDHDL